MSGGAAAAGGTLAHPGEARDSLVSTRELWQALNNCKNEQLHVTSVGMVDLGLIRDIGVRRDVVHVLMTVSNHDRSRHAGAMALAPQAWLRPW